MIDAAAPLDRMPLFVRAGSIIPMGPEVEYASEKPADPIEFAFIRGAEWDVTSYMKMKTTTTTMKRARTPRFDSTGMTRSTKADYRRAPRDIPRDARRLESSLSLWSAKTTELASM